jgi:inner membrane protein
LTWFSHKIFTGSIIYAVTGSSVAALFAAAGSVLPDALEGMPTARNYGRWRKNHRQLTHWFVPYVILAALLLNLAHSHGVKHIDIRIVLKFLRFELPGFEYAVIAYIAGYFAIGAFLHCLEDALCGTVPSLIPSRRVGIKLFTVRSLREFVFVGVVSAMLIFVRFNHGSFSAYDFFRFVS